MREIVVGRGIYLDILGDSSRVALISTSFGSIKALGIGISGVHLGSISVRLSVYEFSFNEYDSVIFFLYNYVMFK